MTRRKFSLGKKNNSNRRVPKNSKGGSSNLDARIHKIEKTIAAQVINPKYITLNYSSSSLVNAGASSTALNPVGQSTDETGRIGDITKMEWIELGVQLASGSAFISGQFGVRWLLVSETSSLGAAASFAQVFNTATPGPTASRNYITRNDKRFHVWHDSGPLTMGPSAFSATPIAVNTFGLPPLRYSHQRISLNNLRVDYSRSNAGTVADIDTNALSFLIFTDNANANFITFGVTAVIKFRDS